MAASLGQRSVRAAGIFQSLAALPLMLVMGEAVFERLYWYYDYTRVYDFILSLFNALMAAAIVFIIYIQRQPIQSAITPLYLKIMKSSCASAVWLCLLFDSIFGPAQKYYYYNPPRLRAPRIISAALSSLVVLFLFYPTLVHAIIEKIYEDAPEISDHGTAEAADD